VSLVSLLVPEAVPLSLQLLLTNHHRFAFVVVVVFVVLAAAAPAKINQVPLYDSCDR
jgi:hypothetical protein